MLVTRKIPRHIFTKSGTLNHGINSPLGWKSRESILLANISPQGVAFALGK